MKFLNKRILAALICAIVLCATLLNGCSTQASGGNQATDGGALGATPETTNTPASNYENVNEEDLDSSWSESESTIINLNNDTIAVDGSGAVAGGSTVTITQAGTYLISGALDDGQILIEAPDDALVRIVLNGVTIHCENSAAINCISADKLVLILAEGTHNDVSDGESYTFPDDETDEPSATIFSKQDLTINGTGSLTVTAHYNNGIGTKDDLILVSGEIQVTAANHAMRGRDSVTVIDASLTLEAGNDGIQSNNDGEDKGWIVLYGGSYVITSAHDGIQAEGTLTIHGGSFDITAGGGSANAPEREATGGFGNWDGGRGGMNGSWGDPGEMPDRGDIVFPQDSSMPENTATPDQAPDATNDTSSAGSTGDTTDSDETATEDTTSDSFKALKAGGDLMIMGGTFTIDSADDAVHSNANVTISGGSFAISTGDDGMHADEDLLVEGETVIDIITCYEGLEGTNVTINGGDITISATDDGINAAGGSSNGVQTGGGAFEADRFSGGGDYLITINGGTIRINAAYDGLDSNGDILITGGELYVSGAGAQAVGGDGALDCDGTFTITGGTVAGTGGTAFAMIGTAGNSINADGTQPVLNFQFTQAQAEGTVIELKDADGNALVSHTAERDFKTIAFSSPEMQDGESYTVYTNGEEIYTVTLSGTMTSLSDMGESVSTGGGMGGGMGTERPDRGDMDGNFTGDWSGMQPLSGETPQPDENTGN